MTNLDSMIFKSYWLDRREQFAKQPHFIKVRVMYGTGISECLWVLDRERGIYPVLPKDLKTNFQLSRKQRDSIGVTA